MGLCMRPASNTHPANPAMPCMTRLSLVRVPVLSKQQMSTLPPKGILKGSVQKIPGEDETDASLLLHSTLDDRDLTHLSEGYEGGVDSEGELDGKLWRYDRGQDEGALQE